MSTAGDPDHEELIKKGSPEYQRTLIAVFCIGVAVMTMLYSVQPILRTVGQEFEVPATQTAFLMSATTLTIATFVLAWGVLAGRIGERPVIMGGLILSVLASLLLPLAQDWTMLVAIRALQGVAIAGPAAATLAWISSNIHVISIAKVSGIYIAATTVGGMLGRILSGFVTDLFTWRVGTFSVAVFGTLLALVAYFLLPQRGRRRWREKAALHAQRAPDSRWKKKQRILSYMFGFVGMVMFVGTFNVLGYRVAEDPWNLGPGIGSMFFLSYLSGTFSSSKAGDFLTRWDTRTVMYFGYATMAVGLVLTLPTNVLTLWAGLLIFCAGFFGIHSIASARASYFHPNHGRGSGIYLLSYYLGSSVGSVAFGLAWDQGQWNGTMIAAGVSMVVLFPILFSVSNRQPDQG